MKTQAAEVNDLNSTFRNWLENNKTFTPENTADYMVIYSAFIMGWLAGRKHTLNEQIEELGK